MPATGTLTESTKRDRNPRGGRPRARAPRPFPIAPLLAATGLTAGQLGDQVKASGETVAYAAENGLTLSEADRWAIRCQHMPEHIWPDLWFAEAS